MNKEEKEALALRLWPVDLAENQFTDNNKEKRESFIFGLEYCEGHNHYQEGIKPLLCPTCNKGELYTHNGYIWCKNKKCKAIFEQQD